MTKLVKIRYRQHGQYFEQFNNFMSFYSLFSHLQIHMVDAHSLSQRIPVLQHINQHHAIFRLRGSQRRRRQLRGRSQFPRRDDLQLQPVSEI